VTARETLDGEGPMETTPEVVSSPDRSKADDDRGMARERTCLAWHRTGLSLLAVGMALLRAVTESRTPVMVVAAVVGLGALTIAGALPVTIRRATWQSVRPLARPPALRRIAVCIEVMAVAAAVLALFPFVG
jgi:uncharacterized membrane protein YidH (DUF202 family)